MSVSKFRFVSPGVQTAEIDNSFLPRTPAEMGPVIVGQSTRGPMMRPVRIQSFSDFVEVFGNPVAGNGGGDIWRDGNRLNPTYGVYAAQAYLRNSSPVTFIRLGGYQHKEADLAGKAGWETANAYGLFAATAVSSSASAGWIPSGSAPLVAVIYSTSSIGLVGSSLSSSASQPDVVNQEATWVRADNANLETRLVINGVTSSFNFSENSKKYIRKVLNTNPVAFDTYDYFLGETFASTLSGTVSLNDKTAETGSALILLKIKDGSKFKKQAQMAESGWIVSQHLGAYNDFTASVSSGEYNVQPLFQIVGLSEGEWNSQNLKVSIEDIKLPANEYVKYGTFTLSIRKADDSDVRPEYLERFSGLTLDPTSDNFIAKRIGDKYTEWDYTENKFDEYGTYDNNSKFIRVFMHADVEEGKTNPSLLPFGFYGQKMYEDIVISGSGNTALPSGTFLEGNNQITGACEYSASFSMPRIPLLTTSDNSPVPSYSSLFWGVQTSLYGTRKINRDYKDYVRTQPVWTSKPAQYQFLFSLDDVSGSIVGKDISQTVTASWSEGNRAAGKSITSYSSGTLQGIEILLRKFDKFNVPLYGGFDGLDILVKNPFNNKDLKNVTPETSYTYNSLKVAIDSLADAEVVEMNLAAMPGITNSSLNSLLIEKCETRGDALAVVDIAGDYDPEASEVKDRKPNVETAIDEVKSKYANTSYGCTFFPWVLVRDNINNTSVWVPPSVAALGTFSSAQRSTELWFAPAGFNRGGLSNGAAGLTVLQTAMRLTSKNRDDLYEANINPIATFPAEGIVIFGQKTLQVTPSALDRINVRRLMIYLKKEISRMATSVLFDPNVEVTWNRFTDMVKPFLASVQSRFGLSDYRVILDNTTTTPDLVDRNIMYAKIMLKPTRAIEFIALDFVITNTGASFAD